MEDAFVLFQEIYSVSFSGTAHLAVQSLVCCKHDGFKQPT